MALQLVLKAGSSTCGCGCLFAQEQGDSRERKVSQEVVSPGAVTPQKSPPTPTSKLRQNYVAPDAPRDDPMADAETHEPTLAEKMLQFVGGRSDKVGA